MCPVLLLLLLSALVSGPAAVLPDDQTGLDFVVAFPENVAYYYVSSPTNQLRITALYDGTTVSITQSTYDHVDVPMNTGDSKVFIFDARLELQRDPVSDSTVRISSNKNITVLTISQRNNSIQTALLLPNSKMGTMFHIPPAPQIPGISDSDVTMLVTERTPFRLVVVNTDQQNTVTISGANPQKVDLKPFQVGQFWLQQKDALQTVKATQPVSVLFGHTCALQMNCTCGLLYTVLPPARDQKLRFLIPPVLARDAAAVLLLSESSQIQNFDPDSPVVETSGTAIFYRPGLLLSLIPESDFGACFAVGIVREAVNFAVILVHKNFTDGVRLGQSPLTNPDWQSLKGTDYMSTLVLLWSDMDIIWHASTTMAVYYVGNKTGAAFGNPAHIISKTPDYRGCILVPEVVKIGDVADGWRESLKYCRDNNLQLISLPTAQFQRQVYNKIMSLKSDQMLNVWIGLRRSSVTGEWYWLNKGPVTDTNWGHGEPGALDDGQCAMLSLESGKNFEWRDEDCCKAAFPVCYSDPVFFNP